MIELPWFPPACSPNSRSRSHWPRTRAMKKTREWGWKAALAVYLDKTEKPTGTIPVLLTFYPPGAYNYDRDNLQAACKGYLDGIAEAWGVNDNQFDPRVQIAEPVNGGKIVVTLNV